MMDALIFGRTMFLQIMTPHSDLEQIEGWYERTRSPSLKANRLGLTFRENICFKSPGGGRLLFDFEKWALVQNTI